MREACLCTVLSARVMVVTETESVESDGIGEGSLDAVTSFSSAPPDPEPLRSAGRVLAFGARVAEGNGASIPAGACGAGKAITWEHRRTKKSKLGGDLVNHMMGNSDFYL